MHNLLCEISTKMRQRVIGRCLAALLAQTYQDYDLLIMNDAPSYPIEDDGVTLEWLQRHRSRRQVWSIPGTEISQAHNHNIALWKRPWSNYEYILRLDDDLILNSFAIERMVTVLDSFHDVAGVAGLYFEHEHNENWFSDRDVPSEEQWGKVLDLSGKVIDGMCSNWHQRLFHINRPGDTLMDVDHLYSACMYRAEAMRRVGGWPEIYSAGVAHGEETCGTYRLHLAGNRLVVHPYVTAQHLRAPGGIRSAGVGVEEKTRLIDDPKRNSRLMHMPGVYTRKLSVGVWAQHSHYVSGATRLAVDVLATLQGRDEFDVYPIGAHEGHLVSPGDAQKAFGRTYTIPDEMPAHVDVLIGICDDPGWIKKQKKLNNMNVPEAPAQALITLFPWDEHKGIDGVDAVAGISKFVASQIGHRWKVAARTIYPLCRTPQPSKRKKKMILVVGRIDYWKATRWLAETFVESKIKGWELHIVGAVTGSRQDDYIDDVIAYAENRDNVFIHMDVDDKELMDLYGKARIVWCAKGIHANERVQESEHFGMVPVEAIAAGCIPLVYDLGGHRETVSAPYRWTTQQELVEKTRAIIKGTLNDDPRGPAYADCIDEQRLYEDLRRLVYQVNAKAVDIARPNQVTVIDRPRRLAVIVDSPRKKTGFATVGNQLIKGFVDAKLDVTVYAILDAIPATHGEFPFNFWPMQQNDLQGERSLPFFMQQAKPDALFALYDPGNLYKYILFNEFGAGAIRNGERIPVVVYFPIEGVPIREDTGMLVERVMKSGGTAFTYSPGCAASFKEQFPNLEIDWAYHGLDHAPFMRYSDKDRDRMRYIAGLEEKFIVGAMGVNKRVKQYDILVYAAKFLRDIGEDKDVLFYVHTEPDEPVLQGYPLSWMVKEYGVENMFMWKPDTYGQRGGRYMGAEYSEDTIKQVYQITRPPTPQGRGFMFGHYDIVSRFNCMDMYLDVSSVEGWGLPPGEAMACGVPTVSVNDGLVRSEVYSDGAFMLEPAYISTWHTGSQLAMVSPRDVAMAILRFKSDAGLRQEYSERGLACAAKYTWQPTVQKIASAIKKALGV